MAAQLRFANLHLTNHKIRLLFLTLVQHDRKGSVIEKDDVGAIFENWLAHRGEGLPLPSLTGPDEPHDLLHRGKMLTLQSHVSIY